MMAEADLAAVFALSKLVHPHFPERLDVLQEKFALFPMGCFVLCLPGEAPLGYGFSHPWRRGLPPALDTLLGRIPDDADTYFIHDIALAPAMRGQAHGGQILRLLADLSRFVGMRRAELVSVSGSAAFMQSHGFTPSEDGPLQDKVRTAYADDAIHMYRPIEPFFG